MKMGRMLRRWLLFRLEGGLFILVVWVIIGECRNNWHAGERGIQDILLGDIADGQQACRRVFLLGSYLVGFVS